MKRVSRVTIGLFLSYLTASVGCANDDLVLGRTFAKSASVTAADGGSVFVRAVDAADLAGTRLDIPPAALPSDTEVVITVSMSTIDVDGATPAGPTVRLLPEGTTLAKPARLTIPYSGAASVRVHARAGGGVTHVIPASDLTVNLGQQLVTFEISAFADFEAAAIQCVSAAECPAGYTCQDGCCLEGDDLCGNGVDDDSDGEVDEGCWCDASNVCGPGGVCLGGVCQTFCGGESSCPYGRACADGVCIDSSDAGLCGNGIIEAGEQCDDGNSDDSDGCYSDCTSGPDSPAEVCGNDLDDDLDGLIDEDCDCSAGVACDRGEVCIARQCFALCVAANDCDAAERCIDGFCQEPVPPATCGNGVVEAHEECDDANLDETDGCLSNCILASSDGLCGNGVVEANEECDDANLDETDGCLSNCILASSDGLCGNGVVEGNEECDDANRDETDGCLSNCMLASSDGLCGNGVVEANEECDDANLDETDGCLSNCTFPD